MPPQVGHNALLPEEEAPEGLMTFDRLAMVCTLLVSDIPLPLPLSPPPPLVFQRLTRGRLGFDCSWRLGVARPLW